MTRARPKLMLLVERFKPEHLGTFEVERYQFANGAPLDAEYGEFLANNGDAFTVRRPDGSVIAVLGLLHQWEGRALAWAILAQDSGDAMLPLTRAIAHYLKTCDYRRIEAYLDTEFPQGIRWARALGFVCETPMPMPGFYPNGNPAFLYARVQL